MNNMDNLKLNGEFRSNGVLVKYNLIGSHYEITFEKREGGYKEANSYVKVETTFATKDYNNLSYCKASMITSNNLTCWCIKVPVEVMIGTNGLTLYHGGVEVVKVHITTNMFIPEYTEKDKVDYSILIEVFMLSIVMIGLHVLYPDYTLWFILIHITGLFIISNNYIEKG